MKGLDTIYIIIFGTLGMALGIFMRGKVINLTNRTHLLVKLLPLFLVVSIIITVFYLNYYYKIQYGIEVEKYKKEFTIGNINYNLDSLIASNNYHSRVTTLDSLRAINKSLTVILENIKNQEKIIGEKSDLVQEVQKKIKTTDFVIQKIESYNSPIGRKLVNGFCISGNTSNFEFYCPHDTISEFIDLKLKFWNDSLVNQIELIHIFIANEKYVLFEQSYLPHVGLNAFKVRNYLKQSNVELQIGYVLKSEMKKKTPTLEKVTCKSKKR
jgi:hypothetical protein